MSFEIVAKMSAMMLSNGPGKQCQCVLIVDSFFSGSLSVLQKHVLRM